MAVGKPASTLAYQKKGKITSSSLNIDLPVGSKTEISLT